MWEIWANYLLPQALKSCSKSNKSPNLVTLIKEHSKILHKVVTIIWCHRPTQWCLSPRLPSNEILREECRLPLSNCRTRSGSGSATWSPAWMIFHAGKLLQVNLIHLWRKILFFLEHIYANEGTNASRLSKLLEVSVNLTFWLLQLSPVLPDLAIFERLW